MPEVNWCCQRLPSLHSIVKKWDTLTDRARYRVQSCSASNNIGIEPIIWQFFFNIFPTLQNLLPVRVPINQEKWAHIWFQNLYKLCRMFVRPSVRVGNCLGDICPARIFPCNICPNINILEQAGAELCQAQTSLS